MNPEGQPQIIQSISLIGPIALLRQAWALYIKRLRIFVFLSIFPLFVTGFIFMITFLSGSFGLALLAKGSNLFTPINIVVVTILIALVIIVLTVISGWGQVAMLYAVKEEDNNIGFKEAIVKGWGKLASYWWISFLIGLINFGGSFLFIIPGIIFSVWFSMAVFVLINEDIKGMNALLKSREYVRGYFWPVLGRNLFWLAFAIILSLIPSLIFEKLLHFPSWINWIYSLSYSFVTTPLGIIYSFLIYKNLRSLKGELAFTPSSKSKAFFISCGIFGIILPIIGVIFAMFLVSGIYNKIGRQAPLVPNTSKADDSTATYYKALSMSYILKKYYKDNGIYPSRLEDLVPKYLPSITLKDYSYTLEQNGEFKLCYTEPSMLTCIGPSSTTQSPLNKFPLNK